MSNYHDFLPDNNLEKKYFSEIANHIESDVTIVSKNFGDPMPDVPGDKIIFMNADEQYRTPEEVNDPSVKLIFKQYCREGQHEKLRPLPLGPSKDFSYTPNSFDNRIYDVTFIGQIAHNRAGLYIGTAGNILVTLSGQNGIVVKGSETAGTSNKLTDSTKSFTTNLQVR